MRRTVCLIGRDGIDGENARIPLTLCDDPWTEHGSGVMGCGISAELSERQ